MKDITFKKATVRNLPQFYTFFKESVLELFPHFTSNTRIYYLEKQYRQEDLKEALKKKEKILFLAHKGKDIVGFLLFDKANGGVGFAHWLAVSPQYQERGVASTLLRLWEKEILSQGGHAINLWTSKNNIPFYKKRGFILAGTFPQAWFGVDYYLFYKKLNKPEEKNYLREFLKQKRVRIKTE